MKTFRMSDEDHAELVRLYRKAQETPVLVFETFGPDTAKLAWDRVREFMNELGRKYGYNPRTAILTTDNMEFDAEPSTAPPQEVKNEDERRAE